MYDNAEPSNLNATEVEQEASSLTTDNDSECDNDGSHATEECINDSAKLDGRLYLAWHQSQQKWESLYPCYFYSASKQVWLCQGVW